MPPPAEIQDGGVHLPAWAREGKPRGMGVGGEGMAGLRALGPQRSWTGSPGTAENTPPFLGAPGA